MKNIHVLPTEKPSILYAKDDNYKLANSTMAMDWYISSAGYKPYNICITSDVTDINENDYIITQDGRLVQVSYLLSKDLEGASKVILTTDQDLIKDGVQAIDDEFLEWFVKNSSCDIVDVHQVWWSDDSYSYEIIIPKEEPKQETLEGLISEYHPIAYEKLIKEITNEETLEYGLLQHIKICLECNNESQAIRLLEKYGFEKQEERYSEEEIMDMFHSLSMHLPLHYEFLVKEQFKKK